MHLENVDAIIANKLRIEEGDASLLEGRSYDLIIANINRNILLEDIPTYVKCLQPNGMLLLSGFYKEDIPAISEKCLEHSLKFVENLEKNHWVAVKYVN